MTATCETCRWFCDRSDTYGMDQGQCRIRAPIFHSANLPANDEFFGQCFPFVETTTWCGEHQPKDKP